MNGRTWKVTFLFIVLILAVTIVIQWYEPQEDEDFQEMALPTDAVQMEDVRAYLPAWPDLTYYFTGDGMEFATFRRKITFVASGLVQIEDLSGTNLARVVECTENELRVIWSEEEFYDEHSLLNPVPSEGNSDGRAENLILLKAPLKKGNFWVDEAFKREIIKVKQVVSVPLGSFHDVVVVKVESLENDNIVRYEYYAKNIGLIKQESVYAQEGKTHTIKSALTDLSTVP